MTTEELLAHCKAMCKKYPSLREEIIDLYRYTLAEIEDGGSIDHECELGYESIQEMIEEYDHD